MTDEPSENSCEGSGLSSVVKLEVDLEASSAVTPEELVFGSKERVTVGFSEKKPSVV